MKRDFIFNFTYIFIYIAQAGVIISPNIETLNSCINLSLETSFIKFDVVVATFSNPLNMAVLGKRLNKTDIETVG